MIMHRMTSHKTSSQKLGRHASCRVRSVCKIFGRVSFGSTKFGQREKLRKNWEYCWIMVHVGPNKIVFPFWLQQWQEKCGIACFWLQQFKSVTGAQRLSWSVHKGYPAVHKGYPAVHKVILRCTTVIPDCQTWVGARDTCVSENDIEEKHQSTQNYVSKWAGNLTFDN